MCEIKIEDIVNGIIKAYIHMPWRIYPKIVAKYETDVVYVDDEKMIKLSARTWQDNYYNDLAERASLSLEIYHSEKGKIITGMSSQFVPMWDEQPDETYEMIEKVISNFVEIANYYKEKEKLLKECRYSIGPGTPVSQLEKEFYNRDWTI